MINHDNVEHPSENALIINLNHNYFFGGYCIFQWWWYDFVILPAMEYSCFFSAHTGDLSIHRSHHPIVIAISEKYFIMMKILPAFFIAFLLMLAALQADAEVLTTTKPKVAHRHLLSEPSSLGRKVSAGANDAETPTSNNGNSSTETKTGSGASGGDDDETNQSCGRYRGGSSTATHHHYTNDTRPRGGDDDDDDETNQNCGRYGGGSSTATHHHYTNDTS
ncbi:hypothetical protein NC653_025531 [Populus alba x Populus x berolinensis]|uniref:Uncharacterized protein n=1 Tax=Populus alba x Populus x berolinensis TaxID=444605 RepID=A0AAD6Q865_9ROSI|nr:hypothetical protein NC653_025531 [Populus alba x Populus x berolinensis]